MELDPALPAAAVGLVLDPASNSAPWSKLYALDQPVRLCVKCNHPHVGYDTVEDLFSERICGHSDVPEYVQSGPQLQQLLAQRRAGAGWKLRYGCDGLLVLRNVGTPGASVGESGSQHTSAPSSERQYVLLEKLGDGCSGSVFLAASRGPSPLGPAFMQLRKVAVKQMSISSSSNSTTSEDRVFEQAVLEQLRRIRLWMLPTFWEEIEPVSPSHRLFAMTYFDAPSIDDLLTDNQTFQPEEVTSFLEQMCILFYRIHTESNLIHCDVSTSNVLVWRAPDGIKLPQFMLADSANSVQRDDRAQGKRLAPFEILRGNSQTASDMYGVGTVALQMLTGVPSDAASVTRLLTLFAQFCAGCLRSWHPDPGDRQILARIEQIPKQLRRVLADLLQESEVHRTASAVALWNSMHREDLREDGLWNVGDFFDDSDSIWVRQQAEAIREALIRDGRLQGAIDEIEHLNSSSSVAHGQPLVGIRVVISSGHDYIDRHQIVEAIRCIVGGGAFGPEFPYPEAEALPGSTIVDFKLPKTLADALALKCTESSIKKGLQYSGFILIKIQGHPDIQITEKGIDVPAAKNPLVFWGSAFVPAGFQMRMLSAFEFWQLQPSVWTDSSAARAEPQRINVYFTYLSGLPVKHLRRSFVAVRAADESQNFDPEFDPSTASRDVIMSQLRDGYKKAGMDPNSRIDTFRLQTRDQLAQLYKQCGGERLTNFGKITKRDLTNRVIDVLFGSRSGTIEQPRAGDLEASPSPRPSGLPNRAKSKSMLSQLIRKALVQVGDTLELRGCTCMVLEHGRVKFVDKDGATHTSTGAAWAKSVLKEAGAKTVPHTALKQAFVYPAAGGAPISLASLYQATSAQDKMLEISGSSSVPAAIAMDAEGSLQEVIRPAQAFDVKEERMVVKEDTAAAAEPKPEEFETETDDDEEIDLNNPLSAAVRLMIPLGKLDKEARLRLLERLKGACGKQVCTLADLCNEEALGVAFDEMVSAGSMLSVLSQAVWGGSVSEVALEEIVLSKLRICDGDLEKLLIGFGAQAKQLIAEFGISTGSMGAKTSTMRGYLSEVLRAISDSGKRLTTTLFDDVAATILAHTLQLDIHVFSRNANRAVSVKSFETGTEGLKILSNRHVVILAQKRLKNRLEYALYRAKNVFQDDEFVDRVSISTMESHATAAHVQKEDFKWDVKQGPRLDHSNPDDPATLETRISEDRTQFVLVRISNRTGVEEIIGTQPVLRKRQKKMTTALDAACIRDYLRELLQLDSQSIGQERVFDLVQKLKDEAMDVFSCGKGTGAENYVENAENIREILTSGMAGPNSPIAELMLLRVFLVGYTKSGKSTLLSSLLYSGMPSAEKYSRLIGRVKEVLGERICWHPATSDFYGFVSGATLPDDHEQKMRALEEVGFKAAAAAAAASISIRSADVDGDSSFMWQLMQKLEERAGPALKDKFVRGVLLPAMDVNATTSVSVFAKLSPFPYCIVSFITEAEHERIKVEALEALDNIQQKKKANTKGRGKRSMYDAEDLDEAEGEPGSADQHEEKVLHALSMVGKEGLVNAQGKGYDQITPADLEFDEEIAEMKRLYGRNLIYVPGTESRDDALFSLQKTLGLFTTNGIRSCWGLVKSAEFGVPSKACDGFLFCDCVGSSRIDTVRRAAAAHSESGGEIDVLLHVVVHQNTPSDVFPDLNGPIRALILNPEDHAVVLAYDARNGKSSKGEISEEYAKTLESEVEQRVINTEWRPRVSEMIPDVEEGATDKDAPHIDEEAIMKRFFFVPYCAAPSFMKAQAKGTGEDPDDKLEKPRLAALCQKLRDLHADIARRRVRKRFQDEI